MAVLYFENNTGNTEMDWLRTGLTDMLVTDLSQSHRRRGAQHRSPGADPRATWASSRIGTISFDTVQEVARRADVKHVLLGSYVKAGDTIRINVQAAGRVDRPHHLDRARRRAERGEPVPDDGRPDAPREGALRLQPAATCLAGLLSRARRQTATVAISIAT